MLMFGDRAYLCHIKQVASAPVPQSISAEALKSESRAPEDRAPRQRWHFFSNHTDRIDGATDGESLCVCVCVASRAGHIFSTWRRHYCHNTPWLHIDAADRTWFTSVAAPRSSSSIDSSECRLTGLPSTRRTAHYSIRQNCLKTDTDRWPAPAPSAHTSTGTTTTWHLNWSSHQKANCRVARGHTAIQYSSRRPFAPLAWWLSIPLTHVRQSHFYHFGVRTNSVPLQQQPPPFHHCRLHSDRQTHDHLLPLAKCSQQHCCQLKFAVVNIVARKVVERHGQSACVSHQRCLI